jgi:hypothetical protein
VAAGFSIGNKGYIGTGETDIFYKDFWEFDPTANTWSQKSDFGGGTRNQAAGFSIGSKGYIGTGCVGSECFRDFWEYTPATAQTNPVPLINQPLVPDATVPGGPGFTLTVNGTGFVSASVVNWNGSARATTFVNSSQLTAAILASDIATANTASVTVVNPSPGGGESNAVFFPITSPTSSVSFKTSEYATGTTPVFVAIGDFNGDSKLDAAVANFGSNTVSVFLGNGDGTFQMHVDYATGGTPSSVAVGDFNRDDKLDLALTNGTFSVGNSVSVLLGNGDGTFQAHMEYTTGLGPTDAAVGDFNLDGKLDLAVANYGPAFTTGSVSILLGSGDGTFQSAVNYPAGVNPISVLVGDFDKDGAMDLAVGDNNYPQGVSVLLGNGDGTFQSATHNQTAGGPRAGIVADMNLDGNLDLAFAPYDGTGAVGVYIFIGNGDGTFQPEISYMAGAGANSLQGEDFNGDGLLDLAVANVESNNVSVLLGQGDGTFQAHVDYGTGSTPVQVAIGDFNGDGRLDLAVANGTSNTISILLQGTTVALSDTSLRFGVQLVGTTSAAQRATLTNTGGSTLTISSIAASGDFIAENNCGSSLPAGASCTIRVAFNPSDKGGRSGAVTITDDAANSPQTSALTGTGTVVQLTPMNVDFGNQRVGTTSRPQRVTLTNTGSTALSIRGIGIVGNNFGDFVETTTCGSSVPANSSCAINVRFRPTATGLRTASVKVQHDGGGAQPVKLRGRGVSNQ